MWYLSEISSINMNKHNVNVLVCSSSTFSSPLDVFFNQEDSGIQLHLMNNPSKSADMHSFEQETYCLAYNLSIMPFILQIFFFLEKNYLNHVEILNADLVFKIMIE